MTDLPLGCEFVVIVTVIGGRGHVASRAHETAVNTAREIIVIGHGHHLEIDDVGRGHVIGVNIDQGHVHENAGNGKINVTLAVLTMKNEPSKNFPLIQ